MVKDLRRRSQQTIRARWGWFFVAPWVIGVVLFNLYPMLYSFYISLTSYSLVKAPKFVGFANYIRLFTQDASVIQGVKHTLYFAVLYIPIWNIIGLIFALLMNQKTVLSKAFRVAVFIPTLVTISATSAVWSWILNKDLGVLNGYLKIIGVKAIPWLTSPDYAKLSIVIMALWPVGSVALIYYVALQNVPKDIIESSHIDGATPLRRFFSITLPTISPTLYFNCLMSVIAALQIFAESILLTKGGPAGSTMFYVYYIYRTAFSLLDFGYASALAWVFFFVVMIFVIAYQRTFAKRVFYQ